jgi:hypothetical protein
LHYRRIVDFELVNCGRVSLHDRTSACVACEAEQLTTKAASESDWMPALAGEHRYHDIRPVLERVYYPPNGRRPYPRHVSESDHPPIRSRGFGDACRQAVSHSLCSVLAFDD